MLENLMHQERLFIPKVPGKLGYAAAEILYREQDDIISIDAVIVDETLRGQGIAAKLMDAIVEKAKAEHKKLYPICSYAVSYLEKHPELATYVTDSFE